MLLVNGQLSSSMNVRKWNRRVTHQAIPFPRLTTYAWMSSTDIWAPYGSDINSCWTSPPSLFANFQIQCIDAILSILHNGWNMIEYMHANRYTHTHFVKLPKFVMQKMINVQHVSIDMNIWKSIEVWWSFLISFSFSYQANNNNNRKTSSKLHNNR